ncbi:hypothetical protein [Nocardia sp. NPDC051570]|uniref:preATP grasp domain-containing protein n=1 Tax=Nocardia sp. NPDC051570 TaxID=3364324 RepID=UPI00379AD383
MNQPRFCERLKAAVAGDSSASLVFLANFEVEQQWARGEIGLPKLSSAANTAVVNRMDEFAILLGGPGDHVLLKSAPDEGYLRYLSDLGFGLPVLHIVGDQSPERMVTEDVLADPEMLTVLSELGARGALLSPHGVSELEQGLAEKTGLALAAPPASLCRTVNSKIYSRRLADELGLRQPRGWVCGTLAELDTAVAAATELLDAGGVVLVKEALGVSGKGIAVVDNPGRLDRLRQMITRAARAAGRDDIAFVIEERVAKTTDLNYQFTISRDGTVRPDFIKEAITEGNVHRGHRFPPSLSPAQLDRIHHATELLSGRLAADGFFGVVGVDAMLDPEGGVYPVVEINARNNMSTYQIPLQERLIGDGRLALARHYPLTLDRPLSFDTVRRLLDGLLMRRPGDTGFVVNNFATVNAAARADRQPFNGRLYGLIVGDTQDRLVAVDTAITERLGSSAHN